MIIRKAYEKDAENLAILIREVESTSNNMLYGPGERPFNPENQRQMIRNFKEDRHSAIFLAAEGQQLIGYLLAKGNNAPRNQHSCYIVVGVSENHRGKGVGTKLFMELLDWATEQGIHRLELTVLASNDAGIALYEKIGFKIEGTKIDSLLIDGRYMDEYYMSLILPRT
ncbi:GNAT family N-acetyltransferase [Bacillus sp. REN3]|uniref:GNAT family N-acetyltransferase n=1 Tax=Bacillus sp. REN3 TaxID=2802440 RepID=UPI001AED8BF8|nr:GNAT family N-acetyltransferase [Bacillus sp. REN3]